MPRQGYIWPLQLTFLIFFVVGIIGLVDPCFFNSRRPVPINASIGLLAVSLAIGLLLYVPPIVRTLKTAGALRRIDNLVHSPQAQQAVADARLSLQRLVDLVGDVAVPDGSVLRRLPRFKLPSTTSTIRSPPQSARRRWRAASSATWP
jgi:hypothetical protein